MTVKKLLNTTREYYEMANRTKSTYAVANVIKSYDMFCTMFQLQLISKKTFNLYFADFYKMASTLYLELANDREREEIKKYILSMTFDDFGNK